MAGETDLGRLLASLTPALEAGDFVFTTTTGEPPAGLAPLATFREPEGITLILDRASARAAGLAFEGVYRQITLQVHSSLEAVGLTAAVATRLAAEGISANVVAAYHHDHIFVPERDAERALAALVALSAEHRL
jgi:uncharacterized protein